MYRKILCALLASLTALSTIACSTENESETSSDSSVQTETSTSDVSEAETEPQLELPDMDFKAEDIHIIGTTGLSGYYVTDDIYTEATTGDMLNDAIFERNAAVMDKYNFTMSFETRTELLRVDVQKAYLAGDDFADLIFDLPLWVRGMTSSGYLTRLDTLEYLDLEKPWWDQNQIDANALAGKTFYLTGDLSLSDDKWTTIVYFNKDMVTRHGMEMPYEMVKEGTWTFDVFKKMSETVYEDTNGNGEADQEDIFGLLSDGNLTNWYNASGYTTIRLDEEGKLYDDFLHDNTFTILETIKTFLLDEGAVLPWKKLNAYGSGMNVYQFGRSLFTTGHLLFSIAAPASAMEFRDMEENYGMIPMPKWDEEQDKYYCPVDGNHNVAFIPAVCQTPDQSAFIMEAMAYESLNNLTPVYNETLVQRKYARDNESSEMFDIIKAARYFSTADYFGVSGNFEFLKGNEIPKMSDYAAVKEKIATAMEDVYNKYMEME